jgi:peptidoglycan biosynthesis protein MviN/MurJ (putative lipid II flippase)
MTARGQALVALFIGAAAAMIDQLVSYVLVYPSQAAGSNYPIAIATIVSAAVATVGLVLGARVLRRQRTGEGVAPVDTFLGLLGVVLNAFFLLVIIGMGLPAMILHPTD